MSRTKAARNELCESRHFHFVALQWLTGEDPLGPAWLDRVGPGWHPDESTPSFDLRHMQVSSDVPYTKEGRLREISSAKGDGNPPYRYHIIVLRLLLGDSTLSLLGYPLAGFGKAHLDLLINQGLGSRADVVCVRVPEFVKGHGKSGKTTMPMHVKIVGLSLAVASEPEISGISLSGEDPLASSLFKNQLEHEIAADRVVGERCTLGLEVLSDDVFASRGRLHFDTHGNFRFYVHQGARNLHLLPAALQWLHESGYLGEAGSNPFRRIQETEP